MTLFQLDQIENLYKLSKNKSQEYKHLLFFVNNCESGFLSTHHLEKYKLC